jgi:hypothetical protein
MLKLCSNLHDLPQRVRELLQLIYLIDVTNRVLVSTPRYIHMKSYLKLQAYLGDGSDYHDFKSQSILELILGAAASDLSKINNTV